MLLMTDDKARVSIEEDFAIVGEGLYLATSSLLQREYLDTFDFEKALYCVYEAKRYAERVASVGEYTSIRVLSSDGTRKIVNLETREKLGKIFLEYGPKNLTDEIDIGNNIYFDGKKEPPD